MAQYTAPVRDMQFVLHDFLNISQLKVPGYQDLEPDFTAAVLNEAGRLATEVLAPLNASGDREGCRFEAGDVSTPAGFSEAYEQLRAGGWTGLNCNPEFGGQGMPYLLATAVSEMFISANMSLNMYPGLTHGAYSTINAHASDALKAIYLPKLVDGIWTGTMNLTEPHCGTDLGLMRTKAEPQSDGSYQLTGQKIFISAGDHDLSENIIHLVLARIPGGPDGIKGLSLFIVPKFLVNQDGSLGERNGVHTGSIEEKMGIHANATCVMNYDSAVGFLIGEEHNGMRAMFTMMNEARLGVGLQGYAQASVAYQNAADYANDRLQGRSVTGAENPDGPADPIVVHPDIRRSLMDQKSFVEGARAFTFWGASLIDQARDDGDPQAEGLVSLLTPVIKGFLTDKGFDTTVQAQQIFGGHGYIEENGMSQFVRDARITQIYEGANGIQALDLVGRKLSADGGRHVMAFFDMVKTFIGDNADDRDLKSDFLDPLETATSDLQAASMYFLENGVKNPNHALAGSYDFMHLFGHVCLGLMWARMAKAAMLATEGSTGDEKFYQTKIATGRYYMARQLPATSLHLARITSGADTVMALAADEF